MSLIFDSDEMYFIEKQNKWSTSQGNMTLTVTSDLDFVDMTSPYF